MQVLRRVSLSIEKGEFTVFAGPSGCGKSTLLRCIAGLKGITAGTLTIGVKRMNEVDPATRGLAMELQSYAPYPPMTVAEKMGFGLGVAIGRSIVRDPLSNLDAGLRVRTQVEIAKLHQALGNTIINVTHDQTEAMTLAQKIAVMPGGRIEQVGPPMALYDDPVNLCVAGFIG